MMAVHLQGILHLVSVIARASRVSGNAEGLPFTCRVTASTHHPWYTTDTSFKEFEQMRISMEPLLYQYGVDVFFNGARSLYHGFLISRYTWHSPTAEVAPPRCFAPECKQKYP